MQGIVEVQSGVYVVGSVREVVQMRCDLVVCCFFNSVGFCKNV